ncbi:hypothetical protein DESC_820028 [Desulfosarcina cetonica]|nr:hypothetical protein DESC_820028 [Desulfosarcina cetonica]
MFGRGWINLQFGNQFGGNILDAGRTVQGDVFHAGPLGSQIFKVVGRCQCAIGGVVVDVVAFVDGRFILIVAAGLQIAAAHPAFVAIGFDGVNVDVVGMVVVIHAQTTAHDAIFGDFAVQQDLDDDVQRHAGTFQGFVQFDGLVLVSGETIQQPAVLAVVLFQAVENHGDGDFIGYQIALVDVGFGLGAQFGSLADVFTENGSGFDVGGVVFVFQNRALGAFAAAIGTKKQDVHSPSPFCFLLAKDRIIENTNRTAMSASGGHGT